MASQRFPQRHSSSDTCSQRAVPHVVPRCPFSQRSGFIAKSEMRSGAAVAGLFLASRPSTVVGRVGTIVVNAVQRVQSGWAPSHVSQKHCKVAAPTVTHHNSATSVTPPGCGTRIDAPFVHVGPNSVFRCAGAPVFRVATAGHVHRLANVDGCALSPETPATESSATAQCRHEHHHRGAAVAGAQPPLLMVSLREWLWLK